jgi:hypothetical protein
MFDRSDGTTGGGCGIFDSSFELGISAEDGRRIREAGRRLDTAVRAAAEKHGWVFVDGIEAGFAATDTARTTASSSSRKTRAASRVTSRAR